MTMKQIITLVHERLIKGFFTKEYWCNTVSEKYHPECFKCNKGDCTGCEFK